MASGRLAFETTLASIRTQCALAIRGTGADAEARKPVDPISRGLGDLAFQA
jgi:hypothetical protein